MYFKQPSFPWPSLSFEKETVEIVGAPGGRPL